MKTTILGLSSLSLLTCLSQGVTIYTNDFELSRPDTGGAVLAELSGPTPFDSYASGVGAGITLSGDTGTATYADDSSVGTVVDNLDWAVNNSGGGDWGKNGIGNSTAFNAFAAWGGDVRIETASPIGTVQAGQTYTLSVMVGGPESGPIGGPLALWLQADGVQLTPSSSVDVVTPNADGSYQMISRTFDAADLSGNVGEALTVVVGVEDANDLGNRVLFDNLEVTAIPEPSSGLMLGLAGLLLAGRRPRK